MSQDSKDVTLINLNPREMTIAGEVHERIAVSLDSNRENPDSALHSTVVAGDLVAVASRLIEAHARLAVQVEELAKRVEQIERNIGPY